MTPEMIFLAAGVAAILVLVAYLINESSHQKTAYTKVRVVKGTVVDMNYVPRKTSTTYGLKYDGKMGMKTTTTPEKHHVYIYVDDIKQKIHRNSERLYQMVRLDDEVEIELQEEYSYDDRKPHEIKFTNYRLISMTSPKGRKHEMTEAQPESYRDGRLTDHIH